MDTVTAARLVGAPVEEVLEVEETPAGDLISMSDGTHFLNATVPDAEGKTGLMFAAGPDAPNGQPYSGVFPVYAQPADLVEAKAKK